MSYVTLPDPHPGRCLNYRSCGSETVRCLEAEGTEHVCRFPASTRRGDNPDWQRSVWTLREPQPWIVPPVSVSGENPKP